MMNETNLEVLLNNMLEIENEIKALEADKDDIKKVVFNIVNETETKNIEVFGTGTVLITKDTKTVSYDAKGLDSLVTQLLRDGEVRTAQAISDLRKESERKGHLMFRRKQG